MTCAWLGVKTYELHYLLHPPSTFNSTASDLTLSLAGLSSRLTTTTTSQVPESLSQAPGSKYYLLPVLPIRLIQDYLGRSEADFLLIDFQEIDLKDESLFRQIYSKVKSPPSEETYTSPTGEVKCSLLMDSLVDSIRQRAAIHLVTNDTEVYEAPYQLAWLYQQWYGQEAYEASLATPRYPVVVLRHTEKWANLAETEKHRLLDFYAGLLKWVGTAHIFIEASQDADRVLASLDLHVSKPK